MEATRVLVKSMRAIILEFPRTHLNAESIEGDSLSRNHHLWLHQKHAVTAAKKSISAKGITV